MSKLDEVLAKLGVSREQLTEAINDGHNVTLSALRDYLANNKLPEEMIPFLMGEIACHVAGSIFGRLQYATGMSIDVFLDGIRKAAAMQEKLQGEAEALAKLPRERGQA